MVRIAVLKKVTKSKQSLEELDELVEELEGLDFDYSLPRWAWTSRQWSEYVLKRVPLKKRIDRLRSLEEA